MCLHVRNCRVQRIYYADGKDIIEKLCVKIALACLRAGDDFARRFIKHAAPRGQSPACSPASTSMFLSIGRKVFTSR